MADNPSPVVIEREGSLGYLVLNRPDKRNAINPELRDAFNRQLDTLLADPEVRVIVVRGNGSSFCGGYDLTPGVNMQEVPTGRAVSSDLTWVQGEVQAWKRLWDCEKPTIAQVHGHCIAGGLMIALECDLVVAAEDAMFGQPEARFVAIAPDHALWPITMGIRKTKEYLFTAGMISGKEARELGMINHAVANERLAEFVNELASVIAKTSSEMLAIQKAAANAAAVGLGIDAVREAGTIYDVLAHVSRTAKEFRHTVREKGFREALKQYE